jgi:heme exporter protein A
MVPVVAATNLSRRFGRRWAYARVDLEVKAGERLLVVGANGSGKTTLLRTLATLLPASEGNLRLFGLDPGRDVMEIRRRLALVSHKPGLYEDLSARDNLLFLAALTGRTADVAALLVAVGLEDRPEAVATYSAGMRKRAALAGLLLQQPELVLLDEPFAALDPAGMDQLGQVVEGLAAAVIIVSHQIEQAASLCHRALLLDQGQVRWEGPAAQANDAWHQLHGRHAPVST